MPNPGQELSSIDFESMIGGPLRAVVNAQAQAAMSTVNFVKQVGFKPAATGPGGELDPTDPETPGVGDPIYVTFEYPKEVAPYQPAQGSTPAQPAQVQQQRLAVPILTMLPIPFIRVEETTIDFKAKIDTMEYTRTDETVRVDASLEARAGWAWGSAKLKVSGSYQKNTQAGETTTRTYSMDVHVRAVQDDVPAGMERVLGILESLIEAHPTSAPVPVNVNGAPTPTPAPT